jgi:hypothetical protein
MLSAAFYLLFLLNDIMPIHCADCSYAVVITLIVVMLSVITLIVLMPSVIALIVVMLIVLAPLTLF